MISKLAADVTIDPLIYPEEEYYPVSEIRTSGTMLFSYAHCAGREGSFHTCRPGKTSTRTMSYSGQSRFYCVCVHCL